MELRLATVVVGPFLMAVHKHRLWTLVLEGVVVWVDLDLLMAGSMGIHLLKVVFQEGLVWAGTVALEVTEWLTVVWETGLGDLVQGQTTLEVGVVEEEVGILMEATVVDVEVEGLVQMEAVVVVVGEEEVGMGAHEMI